MSKFISVLKSFGFKKMPWDKCAQGFKESNYRCYSHKDKNLWCELYLSDKPPYGWIIGNGIKSSIIGGGQFFENADQLQKILQSQS